MTPLHNDKHEPDELSPRDAELTAYLDGELAPEARARVEAWLAAESAAGNDVEADQRLRDLFEEGAIEPPSPHRWHAVLDRIEAAACPAGKGRAAKVWRLAAWFTAAAAVLAGVWLGGAQWFRPGPADDNPRPDTAAIEVFQVVAERDVVIDDMDPFDVRSIVRGSVPRTVPAEMFRRRALEVANAEEVAVITMDGNDTDVLVVGEAPVMGNLVMARRGEVRVDHIVSQGRESMRPYLHEPGGSGMPMIMVPLKTVRRD